MRILLSFATEPEVDVLRSAMRLEMGWNSFKEHQIFLLCTGVGMTATALSLGAHLALNQYDVAINAGIAGAFDKRDELGKVFLISSDCFSELGAEDRAEFIDISQLGFGNAYEAASAQSPLSAAVSHLDVVPAITVNTVHGNEASIARIISRCSPRSESMEGAAFFMACRTFNLPCIQLRSVSNYVEPRDREAWDIPLAIKNLNQELLNIFQYIS